MRRGTRTEGLGCHRVLAHGTALKNSLVVVVVAVVAGNQLKEETADVVIVILVLTATAATMGAMMHYLKCLPRVRKRMRGA